jgi:outer membrane cobalamin receptor
MKKLLLCCLSWSLLALSWADTNPSNDDAFVSLTRSPENPDNLPTNISVVTRQDIAKSGATTVADLLDFVTSVDVGRSGSLGSSSFVRMRGVPSANQVQVLVDDQPIGGSSIQNINLTLLPVDNIDRIEIVRGGASVLYGANSVGGIVHIITK